MTTPKIDKANLAANYGFALAFMNSNPELSALFNKAVKGTWTPDKFVAQLRNTKWFKTNSASVRNAILQETADPATYKANVDQMKATVADEWGKMWGPGGAGLSTTQIGAWAETAQRMGWNEAQLIDHMTAGLNYQKLLTSNSLGGTVAETSSQLDQLTANYGVDPGATWKAGALENITNGTDTIGGVQDRVRELAKQQYGAFADAIDSGQTVAQIADPYKQKMADLLEVSPDTISLQDAKIQNALTQKAPDGKPAALTLTDFASGVRQDPRWQYTSNAKAQVADVGSQLLRSFGLM